MEEIVEQVSTLNRFQLKNERQQRSFTIQPFRSTTSVSRTNIPVIPSRPVTVPQQIPPATQPQVVRNDLADVQSIIYKVDDAFKKRQVECQRLTWEIDNLEKQLECLQKHTSEYAEVAAAQGASLSWTNNNLENLENEIKSLIVHDLKDYKDSSTDLINLVEEVYACANNRGQDIKELKELMENKKGMIDDISREMDDQLIQLTTDEERYYDLSEQYNQKNEDLKVLQIKHSDLLKRKEALEMDIANLSLELSRVDEESALIIAQINPTKEKLSEIYKKTSDIKPTIEKLAEELADNREEVSNVTASLENKLNLSSSEMINLTERIDETEKEILAFEEDNKSLYKVCTNLEIEIAEEKLQEEDKSNEFSKLTAKLEELIEDNRLAEEAILDLKLKISCIENKNDCEYEITCAKLKEIKSLHQIDAVARYELIRAREALSARTNSLTCELKSEIALVCELENTLIYRQNELEVVRSEFEASQLSHKRKEENILSLENRISEKELAISTSKETLDNLSKYYSDSRALLQETFDVKEEIKSKSNNLQAAKERMCQIKASIIAEEEKMKSSISADINSYDNIILSEAEADMLQREVDLETAKITEDLNKKYKSQIEEIESYREKIKNGFPNNPRIKQLKEEIAELERRLLDKRHVEISSIKDDILQLLHEEPNFNKAPENKTSKTDNKRPFLLKRASKISKYDHFDAKTDSDRDDRSLASLGDWFSSDL